MKKKGLPAHRQIYFHRYWMMSVLAFYQTNWMMRPNEHRLNFRTSNQVWLQNVSQTNNVEMDNPNGSLPN